MTDPISDFADAWIEMEDGRSHALLGNCRLGRNPDNDIIVNGKNASRYHAVIHAQGESEFWLIDLGSLNGTFLNGSRVLNPTRLRDGDKMMLAGVVFHIRQPVGARSRVLSMGSDNATVMDFNESNAWMMIVDIEGFTQLCQSRPTNELAVNVGTLMKEGQTCVSKTGGRISKFLGDGFLASWEATEDRSRAVVDALSGFRKMRESGPMKFRVVVHHGKVAFGGAMQFGEDNMLGAELNYIFRLEDLASKLRVTYCASASAQPLLEPYLALDPVEGEHPLKGYPGLHRCFSIRWP